MRAALTEEKVPERVPVERKQVERAAVRNHKIRTDTGIEISFPAEMGSNSEYIEFVNEPNGLISIELKTSAASRIDKLRYACSEKAKAEASDEGFGLFTWGLISLLVEHKSAKRPRASKVT